MQIFEKSVIDKDIKLKLFTDETSHDVAPIESMLNINIEKWKKENPRVRIVATTLESRMVGMGRDIHFFISILVHYYEEKEM